MSDSGFDSPEEAARGDIPERYARALATVVSPSGEDAVVLLATNEEPCVYPYVVVCHRRGGRWLEGSGGNNAPGSGWSRTNDDHPIGVAYTVGEAPEGTSLVVVTYRGEDHRVRIAEDGYFVFAVWDMPPEAWEEMEARFLPVDGSGAQT